MKRDMRKAWVVERDAGSGWAVWFWSGSEKACIRWKAQDERFFKDKNWEFRVVKYVPEKGA